MTPDDPRLGHGFVPGRHAIDAFGQGGFRFAGMSHKGSILALPSGILAWRVAAIRDLSPSDLQPALDESPRIDVLLIGTGLDMVPLSPELRRPFREAGISVDTMQTGAAARTYNILVGENRRVGAALIAVG